MYEGRMAKQIYESSVVSKLIEVDLDDSIEDV